LTTKHQKTLQERTFDQLADQEWESLSEAARTVIEQALEIASKWYLIHNISYMSEWYEDDMKAMRRTVAGLTEHDCKGLTHIWRSALATAASIDPYDYETHLGYGVYPADLYGYYKEFSRMVEDIEWEKRYAEVRKKELAEQEPIDVEDAPF